MYRLASLLQIEQRRQVLRLAGMEPHKEPARPTVHWDFMLKEMRWMAVDFTEVRYCSRNYDHPLVRVNIRYAPNVTATRCNA